MYNARLKTTSNKDHETGYSYVDRDYLLVLLDTALSVADWCSLPNDVDEHDRWDDVARRDLRAMGCLHRANLTDPQCVLDLGPGTGLWARWIASQCPLAAVVGLDLMNIESTNQPPNLSFEQGDVNNDLPYESDIFDLVNLRHMDGCTGDWPRLFREAYRVLVGGGWIECLEQELPIQTGNERPTYLSKYTRDLQRASGLSSRPLNVAPELGRYLRSAGFVDITVRRIEIPLHAEHRSLAIRALLPSAVRLFTSAYDSPIEEVIVRCALAGVEIQDHYCISLYSVCARKPSQDSNSLSPSPAVWTLPRLLCLIGIYLAYQDEDLTHELLARPFSSWKPTIGQYDYTTDDVALAELEELSTNRDLEDACRALSLRCTGSFRKMEVHHRLIHIIHTMRCMCERGQPPASVASPHNSFFTVKADLLLIGWSISVFITPPGQVDFEYLVKNLRKCTPFFGVTVNASDVKQRIGDLWETLG